MATVLVPPARLDRWASNFAVRHGDTTYEVIDGRLAGRAADGSTFSAALPFSRVYSGAPELEPFLADAVLPAAWGVLLVRKGGFAVARLSDAEVVDSKVGQRHVQGRTKAGGQSQQRFARRRANQARVAYEAAAEHAVRVLGSVPVLVTGGDASAVSATLSDDRLQLVSERVVGEFLTVPDPRRSVLEEAILDAGALQIVVVNA